MNMTNKQNLTNSVLVIACLAVVLGLAGCQQKGTAEKAGKKIDQGAEKVEQKIGETAGQIKESVTEKTEKAGEYIDDTAITLNVKTAISNDASLKASEIEVTTVNGVVKLSGTVDSEQSLNKAIDVASSQKNVKSVQSDLVVNAGVPNK